MGGAKALIVAGIFPPDIGGPATYVSEIAAELSQRHDVKVLTLADELVDVEEWPFEVVRIRRGVFKPMRWWMTIFLICRCSRGRDLIYANGLTLEAALASIVMRKPLVAKVVGDLAWEQAVNRGWTSDGFETFQSRRYGARIRLLKVLRTWPLKQARRVIANSDYTARVLRRWGISPQRIDIIQNSVEVPLDLPQVDFPLDVQTKVATAVRFVPWKGVEGLVRAVASLPSTGAVLIGDGPLAPRLQALSRDLNVSHRVHFAGQRPKRDTLALIKSSDIFVLNSDWESFPHAVLEAMALGVAVVATATGGTAEIIRHEETGLLVSPGHDLAPALRTLAEDDSLRKRLALNGKAYVERELSRSRMVMRTEETLLAAAGSRHTTPSSIWLGKTLVPDPPGQDLERKYSLLASQTAATAINVGRPAIRKIGGTKVVTLPRLRPSPLGSALFYTVGPILALWFALGRRRNVIVCQSPFEGVGVILFRQLVPRRYQPKVVIEAHGDWRTAARLYGSPLRKIIAPLSDRVAAYVVRRADRIRVVALYLDRLVREVGYVGEIDRFVTYSDFSLFADPEPVSVPTTPAVAFSGGFQPYKAVDVLVEAWRRVSERLPEARLVLAGDGPLRVDVERRLQRLGLAHSVHFAGSLSRRQVRDLLDHSWGLVLPSRSEGLPRIVFEAMLRSRGVVATTVGDIPEVISHERNGYLVDPDDPEGLAEALVRFLSDRERAVAMGAEGRRGVLERGLASEYRQGIERLAAWVQKS